MKRHRNLFLVLLFGLLFSSPILAQDPPTTPEEIVADLHAKLMEVQDKEADLQIRMQQLDEALQPENIERSLAGIGSTRPEELREQRRRELTIERNGVRRQLDVIATSRLRLESAIQVAENHAYQQSARGFAGNQVSAIRMFAVNTRLLVIASVTLLGLLAIGGLVALNRRS